MTTRSTPLMISGRSGEVAVSSLTALTGRTLANSPSSLRNVSSACSGRLSALGSSHLGPPTAPSKIASQSCACLSTSSGKRRAELIDRMAAGDAFLELEIERGVTRHHFEHLQRFADDFGTDPVTLENQNLVGHLCLRSPSSGSGATDRLRADSLQASRGRGQIRQIRQFGSSCGGRNLPLFDTFRRGSVTHVLPDAIST